MAASEQDIMMARIAQSMGMGTQTIKFTRVEFSTDARLFLAQNEQGEVWGGQLGDTHAPADDVESRLVKDAKSGGLGQYFAIFAPMPEELVATQRAKATDWRVVFGQ